MKIKFGPWQALNNTVRDIIQVWKELYSLTAYADACLARQSLQLGKD